VSARADLHIHTLCSDGQLAPADVIEHAADKKLSCISITDHDTYEGYLQAAGINNSKEIEVLPGVEITSVFNERECHILAYCFDPEDEEFRSFIDTQRLIRRRRIKIILKEIAKKGIDISYDEVRAEADGANVGRPHIARVMMSKGYVGGFNEAFIRYLSSEKLGDIQNAYRDFATVIKKIKSAGGASVLAHPGLLYSDDEIETFIEAGIDGLECIHPSHNYSLQKKYTELAEKNLLLMTGGSDFHGSGKDIDRHFGTNTIHMKYVERLKRMTKQRKALL